MDFTPELLSFHGVLISADNVYSFPKLTAKGGNEDKIDYIIEVIRNFFRDQKFLGPNNLTSQAIPKVRKYALYLILNANFRVLDELVENEEINSVIWTVPTIPKCLLCELVWNLHMEVFLYEAITFTHPQLALELAEAFLYHFKYFNPTKALIQIKKITTACYLQICRLSLVNLQKDDLVDKLTKGFTNLQNSLNLFTKPPNEEKLNSLSKDDLYMYKGRRFEEFLLCAHDCLNQFTNSLDTKLDDVSLYFVTYKEGILKSSTNCKICATDNEEILECMNNCNESILNTCRLLVMDISVDIFCSWSEFEENGKSMQESIGELCYKLLNKIAEIPSLAEHPVVSMMQQIARKPNEIKDVINVTDSNTIVENINKNDKDKDAWLYALLERKNVCQDSNLINIIEANLHVFDAETSYKLYQIIQSHLNYNAENQNLKLLAVKVFQQCALSNKYKILNETFHDNVFSNINETIDLNNMMTEIFNKLVISPEADEEVLTVFLQNPCEVYKKICGMAIESPQQADIMLKVSLLFKEYRNNYYANEIEPCVINCTRIMLENSLDTEAKQNNAVKFVCGLKGEIIPENKLLLLIMMPTIHKDLTARNIANIHVQVRILKEGYSVDELIVYRAPMLAMLGQIMHVLRWKVDTYTPISPSALEDAIQLQKSLIETYNDHVPEKEKVWLKSKLINLETLNLYYYRILWKPPGNNFLEVISGRTLNFETNTNDIISLLSQILCSVTQQEWCDIWDSLHHLQSTVALKILSDALSIQTLAEANNRIDSTWTCLHYCYRCFFYVSRYKYFKEPLSGRQVSFFANRISAIAKLIKEENAEDICNILLPLLAYLSERQQEHNIDFATYLKESLRNTPLAFVVNLVFHNT